MTRSRRSHLLPLLCGGLVAASLVPASAHGDWKGAPIVPRIDRGAQKRILGTTRRGRRLGRHVDVFAKVGDSISQSPAFLQGLGCDRWTPGRHAGLGPTVRFFAGRRLPGASSDCARVNSFSRNSAATLASKTSSWALTRGASPDPSCRPQQTPLVCELRITRPGYAVVLLGSNDASLAVALNVDPLAEFVSNLSRIVATTRRAGVVPILTTIPPRTDAAAEAVTEELNAGLTQLAHARHVPLMNLWRAFEALPNHGLTADGLHPSLLGGPKCGAICDPDSCAPRCRAADFTAAGLRFGYDVRNLDTLLTLRRVSAVARKPGGKRD